MKQNNLNVVTVSKTKVEQILVDICHAYNNQPRTGCFIENHEMFIVG